LLDLWYGGVYIIVRSSIFSSLFAAADRIFRYFEKRHYMQLSPSINALLLSISAGMLLHFRDQQPQMLINFLFRLRG